MFLRPDLTVEWDNYAKASIGIAIDVVMSGDLLGEGNPVEEITGPGASCDAAPAASERAARLPSNANYCSISYREHPCARRRLRVSPKRSRRFSMKTSARGHYCSKAIALPNPIRS